MGEDFTFMTMGEAVNVFALQSVNYRDTKFLIDLL